MSHRLIPLDWPTLLVEGPDAATWLNGIVTCDVTAVERNEGLYGLLLNKQGKIQASLQVAGRLERVLVGLSGGEPDAVVAALDKYLVMEDAELGRTDARWALVLGEDPRAVVNGWAGLAAVEPGWGVRDALLIVAEPGEGFAALDALGSELGWADAQSWENFRLQRGVPVFGADYGGGDNPHQAALERRAVSWDKGCYLGQEVVCMQDMRGKVKRRLMALRSLGPRAWPIGATVRTASGDEAGQVTSGAADRGFAMLRTDLARTGTVLHLAEGDVSVEDLLTT